MMRTLELCKVYAVINGELFNKGRPLTLPEIEPMEGAEQPKLTQFGGLRNQLDQKLLIDASLSLIPKVWRICLQGVITKGQDLPDT